MKLKLLPYIILGLLVLTLPIAIFVAKTRQEIRQRAAEEVYLKFEQTNYIFGLQPFSVNLIVNTLTSPVAGVKAVVNFDPIKLRAENISIPTTNPFLPNLELPNIDNQQGIISANILSDPNTPPAGQGQVLTIRFTPLQVGLTSLTINPESIIVGAYDPYKGVNILTTTQPSSSVTITGAGVLKEVRIHPPSITTTIGAGPTGLSALAYDYNNQPIWSGVTYEWGMSSTTSVGTVNPVYGNITNFTPKNIGTGQLWVIARQNDLNVTGGVIITVNPRPSPSSSPSTTPVPTRSPSPTPTFNPSATPIVSPSLTPSNSPLPTPNASLTLKVKFEGVDGSRTQNALVNVQLWQATTNVLSQTVQFANRFDSIANKYIYSNIYPFTNIPTGNYDVFITGPLHLTRLYRNINLAAGTNAIDLTIPALLAGDTNGDNIINLVDYNRMIENFGCAPGVTPPGKDCTVVTSDLNLDGEVEIFDYGFLVGNYNVSGD